MIYTANTKRNPKHRDPVQDDDLLRLLGEEQKKLPWLPDLLEELQALRNEHRADIQDLMDAYFRVKNRDCDLLDDALDEAITDVAEDDTGFLPGFSAITGLVALCAAMFTGRRRSE